MTRKILLLLSYLAIGSWACNPGEIEYYVSDVPAFPNEGAMLRAGCLPQSSGPGDTLTVHPELEHQSMVGFGAALSDSTAYLIWNSPQRDTIIRDLFGTDGARISMIRVPFDGSDFMAPGEQPYVFQESPQGNFDISKDERYILPTLRAILAVRPDVQIVASPWSAPAWAKYPPYWDTSASTLNGGAYNSAFREDYAEYLRRFIEAYRNAGVPIHYLTLQNEPLFEARYPSMLMSPREQAELAQTLRSKLDQSGLSTKILVFDHNWQDAWYPIEALGYADTRNAIEGAAFHCYGGDYQDPLQFTNAHPDKGLFFTECTGSRSDEAWARVMRWNMHNLFIGQPRIGAKSVLMWNLALNENDGPYLENPGCTNSCGCKDCRGVITVRSDNSVYWRNIEYYAIAHSSKFVEIGAKRVESSSGIGTEGAIESVSYKNPDGTVIVVANNNIWTQGQSFNLDVNFKNYYFDQMPAEGVVTFVIKP